MTGQITHIIPILISVLISNAIAALLQPSCYDSIILIKKLPYLPDILPSSSKAYSVFVDDFMLRDIKYIWYGMTGKELRNVLKDGKKLRAFPLVDNPDSMVLLGSIQRMELIQAVESLVGKTERLQVARQRYELKLKQMAGEEQRRIQQRMDDQAKKAADERKAAEEREKAEIDKQLLVEAAPKQRRPSRFEVTTVNNTEEAAAPSDDASAAVAAAANLDFNPERRPSFLDTLGLDPNSPAMKALIQLSTKPKKSILKKSNSYTIHAFGIPGMSSSRSSNSPAFTDDSSWKKRYISGGPSIQDSSRNYKTVTGVENPKWKHALDNFHSMFKKPSTTNMYERGPDILCMAAATGVGQDVTDYMGSHPKVDMSLEEQQDWEEEQMATGVDFDECQIDPSPFQLVEKTSLLKVHSLFSMVGVNHAYVTAIGRLIGVVGLKELRSGIENANSGKLAEVPAAPAVTPSSAADQSLDEHHVAINDEADFEKPPKAYSEADTDTDYSDTEMLPKKSNNSRIDSDIDDDDDGNQKTTTATVMTTHRKLSV